MIRPFVYTIGTSPAAVSLAEAFGPWNESGNAFSFSSGLTLDRSAGNVFNYEGGDNTLELLADLGTSWTYHYQDGAGGWTSIPNETEIDPGLYDDGDGGLATATSSDWTSHRVYIEIDGSAHVYYGQRRYWSSADAVRDLNSVIVEDPATSDYVFRGWVVVNGTATDLTDSAQGQFVIAENGPLSARASTSAAAIDINRGTGWAHFTESVADSRVFLSGVRKKLDFSAAPTVLSTHGPVGASGWWDQTDGVFQPDNEGDAYALRVQFDCNPSGNSKDIFLELDIGGTLGTIWSKTLHLIKGAGANTYIIETMNIYALDTFVANGGTFYATVNGDATLTHLGLMITRTFRSQ